MGIPWLETEADARVGLRSDAEGFKAATIFWVDTLLVDTLEGPAKDGLAPLLNVWKVVRSTVAEGLWAFATLGGGSL